MTAAVAVLGVPAELAVVTVLGLAAVVGLVLGLLGGGGSILAVPLLLYVAGLAPKTAIATSLVVVGATAAAALWPHARAGNVRWRVGLVFGATAMVGAFGGGLLARFIPAWVLLLAFSLVMLATAIAMLRGGESALPSRGDVSTGSAVPARPAWLIALEGVGVGAITGMVGAGGGFLVVPALVVLGRLPMREAIGTSLLVIAMKSGAGFAGYASHVSIDAALALQVTAAAVVGAFAGTALGRRISADALRAAFGWFVIVMALYMLGHQLPASVTASAAYRAVFVDRWPWWAGGAAIGAFVLVFLYVENKLLGVSTGYAEACALRREPSLRNSWRLPFLAGIALGGLASALLGGGAPTFALGAFDALWSAHPVVKTAVLLAAGVMIGFGARTAGGCTSGHSIVGVAQGARSSLVATGAFMAAGFAVTHLVVALLGGS